MLMLLLAGAVSYASEMAVPQTIQNVNFRDGVCAELVYEKGDFFVVEDSKKSQIDASNLHGLARGLTPDLLKHYESTGNVLFDVKKNGSTFEIYTRFLLLGGMQPSKWDRPEPYKPPQQSGLGVAGSISRSHGVSAGVTNTSPSGNSQSGAGAFHGGSAGSGAYVSHARSTNSTDSCIIS